MFHNNFENNLNPYGDPESEPDDLAEDLDELRECAFGDYENEELVTTDFYNSNTLYYQEKHVDPMANLVTAQDNSLYGYNQLNTNVPPPNSQGIITNVNQTSITKSIPNSKLISYTEYNLETFVKLLLDLNKQ